MKGNRLLTCLLVVVVLTLLLGGVNVGFAGPLVRPLLQVDVPNMVSYQGQVSVGGVPYNGTGYFKFAIIDDGENIIWSNDGLEVTPTNSISLTVSNGFFKVLLGDTTIMSALPASVFNVSDRSLRIWFSSNGTDFTQLSPDQRIAAVPYAFQADMLDTSHLGNSSGDVPVNNGNLNVSLNADKLDGNHANTFQLHYQHYVVVAKSGGDYSTITDALDSISGADKSNTYLVKVMPGIYVEQVTMEPYVDIEGSGELVTKITYKGSVENTSKTGTLLGASHAELRWLSVENTGTLTYSIGINNFNASPRLTHVTVSVLSGAYNWGIYNYESSPAMTNIRIYCNGEEGQQCKGVESDYLSNPKLKDVSMSIYDALISVGIYNGGGSYSELNNVYLEVFGSEGSNHTYGVINHESESNILDSFLYAAGADVNIGILNQADSGWYEIFINNSQILADTYTISNDDEFITFVGASQLGLGSSYNPPSGGLICAGVYDDHYNFYPNSCP